MRRKCDVFDEKAANDFHIQTITGEKYLTRIEKYRMSKELCFILAGDGE